MGFLMRAVRKRLPLRTSALINNFKALNQDAVPTWLTIWPAPPHTKLPGAAHC